MLPTPSIVAGDAHLGVASPAAEKELLGLLRAVPGMGRSLVIMGDLFDFWFAWKHAMPRVGFRVLAALADLTESGIPVVWIGGNHDCWSGEAIREETGVNYTLRPWRDRIGPWDVLLEHGDGLRKSDGPYRRLRTVLRHPLSAAAFGWLHPNLASWLASKSSDTSRNARAHDEGVELRSIGEDIIAREDGPDIVIHGHSHVPMLVRAAGGIYANAGAWYLDQQFLTIDDESISLNQWKSAAAPQLIQRADRGNE